MVMSMKEVRVGEEFDEMYSDLRRQIAGEIAATDASAKVYGYSYKGDNEFEF
jgi:hypothetical protein